jgi:hypothetical protein
MIRSLSRGQFARHSLHTLPKPILFPRKFSSDDDKSSEATTEWRKVSLDRLEQRFTKKPSRLVKSEEDLQPEWKAMESRVTKRRTLTIDQFNGKTGRENIRKTDEDIWMESGLYDEGSNNFTDNK